MDSSGHISTRCPDELVVCWTESGVASDLPYFPEAKYNSGIKV